MNRPTVVVGRVTHLHGVRGEVAVDVFSDNPARFADGAVVFIEDGERLTVRRSRRHGARLLVAFEEIQDRTAAEGLRGRTLVVRESMLPELPEGQWWPHQLVGCTVVTESGRSLGSLVDVIPNPANDIWVACGEDGAQTLVPALKHVIASVDVAQRRGVGRDVAGLTVPEG